MIAELNRELIREGREPLYQQVQRHLRQAIRDERLPQNSTLPPERDLALALDVARVTIRKAIDGLADEGLITRRRGAGTFVTGRVEKIFSRLSSFSEDMTSRGRKPHSVWLSKSEGRVTPQEALSLGLSPGALVYRIQRVRYADGQTMALEHSTIPAYCLPSLDAIGGSLYDALEATGHRPVRALQRLRAIKLTSEQADPLAVKAGDAGLFIERRGFLSKGHTCEFTQSYYRGDSYDVVAELNDIM